VPPFMDIRQDLKLPARVSAQIAGDTGQARADRSRARQPDPCQNPRGVHYLPGRARSALPAWKGQARKPSASATAVPGASCGDIGQDGLWSGGPKPAAPTWPGQP
jgi:hypothetical protein